jgi:FkbM family methyltransferase
MASVIGVERIFELISKAGVQIDRAAEIGVYSYKNSAIKPLIERSVKCDLFEAVPVYAEAIYQDIKKFPNVQLFNVAVADYNGEMTLYLAGPSTFNAQLKESPAINHDRFSTVKASTIKVSCRDFGELDHGFYDYVSIDVEGGEFSILSRMKSRPFVINLETQSRDYINPKLGSITDWMCEYGYRVWFRNDTDTLFIKGQRPSAGTLLDLNAWIHNYKYFSGRL